MPTVALPPLANLEQIKKQAKDLRSAYQAGEPHALAHVAEHFPSASGPLKLQTAQVVIARHYGFSSWAGLKRHVELLAMLTRLPDRVEPTADAASEFLRLACLNYADDGAERWEAARQVLISQPRLGESDIHVAAAVADVASVDRLLAADPTLAARQGGPFRWEPLFYLAYARHDPNISRDAVLATAARLLDAGADPNAGYLWHGLPTPFTVLTGVFGEGELGPKRQPRHPHSLALARLLLAAGADANDGQALYNRMFEPGNDHLELLFEFGLGAGDGGPWRARLGDAVDSPAGLVRGQLHWAITHDLRERVNLLVVHGVDLRSPFEDGRTPAAIAALNGNMAIVDLLVSAGAAPADLGAEEAFVAAALSGDRAAIDRLAPGVVEKVRADRPGLMVWAAANGRTRSVALLADLGFDVNARGRGDAPVEQPWETALHRAAENGDLALAELLVNLGADPSQRDQRFDATPLGWARYFNQPAIADLLAPITPADNPS